MVYLSELRLPRKLAQAIQDIHQRYQQLRSETDYQDTTQKQLLQLEEEVFLQELEVLVGTRWSLGWRVRWTEVKALLLPHFPQLLLGLVGVLGLMWYVNHPIPSPELTIFVRDPQGAPILAGKAEVVLTTSSHRSFRREIESDGMVDFSNLSPEEFNDSIQVALVFSQYHLEQKKLWQITGPSKFLYQGEALTLTIDKTPTWGWIRGQVLDFRTERPLAGASIQVNDCAKVKQQSDSLGNFDFFLPRESWKQDLHVGYRVRARLEGHGTKVVMGYNPLSSGLDFRLDEE